MKQIEVKIMGQAYLLGAPEGGEERKRLRVDLHRLTDPHRPGA